MVRNCAIGATLSVMTSFTWCAAACGDIPPQPSKGGKWCSDGGYPSTGTYMCWGWCAGGCPDSVPSGCDGPTKPAWTTVSGHSTSDSCWFGTTAPLCCLTCITDGSNATIEQTATSTTKSITTTTTIAPSPPPEPWTIPVVGANFSARPSRIPVNANDEFYVIMGMYRIVYALGYHETVITCPRSSFNSNEQKQLDDAISKNYWTELHYDWWSLKKSVTCKIIQFGGEDPCDKTQCSGIGHSDDPLSSLEGFDSGAVWKYIYGTGAFDADGVYRRACDHPIPSADWDFSQCSYQLMPGPNCNTFVNFVLKCAYEVDACKDQCKKPYEGIGDNFGIKCVPGNGLFVTASAQGSTGNISVVV